MNTKMCRKCGKIKSIDDFHKGSSKQDNRHPYCKVCATQNAKMTYRKLNQKDWMNEQANDNRIAMLRVSDDIKAKYNCVICGESHPICLEFHHIDPGTKDGNVSKFLHSKSIKKSIAEINKCVILCSNCHQKFHAGLVQFDESKRCDEDLEYWKDIYKKHKSKVISKKRELKNSRKNSRREQSYCACGNKVSKHGLKCIKCESLIRRKADRPPKEQLLEEIKELGYCGTGRKYNVSDNAIRKWIK